MLVDAAHVLLPGVAARFAAAAGFLLAAEGAADLGAARADVHVDDAAVRTGRRAELLRLADVAGENRRRQPLRHAVVDGDRLVEVAVAHQIQNRRERFLLHDRRVGADLDDAPAARRRRPPARRRSRGRRRAPCRLGSSPSASAASIASNAASSISGPTSVPVRGRIADRQPLVDRQQPVAQLVGDRLVHDQPPQRRAALAAGADGGEHDRPHGQVEIGRRRDDHAVVAAELQAASGRAAWRPSRRRRGPSAPSRSPRSAAAAATRPAAGPTSRAADDQARNRRRHVRRPRPASAGTAPGTRSRTAASSPTASTRPDRRTPTRCAAFHAHTATGKLNAVITPTGPSGCHCSVSRWPGRSLAIVLP